MKRAHSVLQQLACLQGPGPLRRVYQVRLASFLCRCTHSITMASDMTLPDHWSWIDCGCDTSGAARRQGTSTGLAKASENAASWQGAFTGLATSSAVAACRQGASSELATASHVAARRQGASTRVATVPEATLPDHWSWQDCGCDTSGAACKTGMCVRVCACVHKTAAVTWTPLPCIHVSLSLVVLKGSHVVTATAVIPAVLESICTCSQTSA